MNFSRWFLGCVLLVSSTQMGFAATFAGNGNSGFGGVIGTGTLDLTNSGLAASGTLTRGAGSLNDAAVFYIDSVAGGFASTATFDDTADPLRRAISGFDGVNRSTVNFASGFGADFSVAIDSGFAGLWALSGTGSHTFVAPANLSPTGNPNSNTFTFSFSLADLGLVAGDSFDFVGTYLNSGNVFRSDEAFGGGIAGGNPGQSSVAFSDFQTFQSTAAVPEPSSFLLVGLAISAYSARRRYKQSRAAS